ncbi:MAG: hypothetical protein ACFFC7_07430, partial [Candidatus Hermodarchaeota archaeon]
PSIRLRPNRCLGQSENSWVKHENDNKQEYQYQCPQASTTWNYNHLNVNVRPSLKKLFQVQPVRSYERTCRRTDYRE